MRRLSVAALVLPCFVALGTSAPVLAYVSTDDLELAREFRSTVGFDTATDTLVRAATDELGYPDRAWGVPLTVAEAAELQRRIGVVESAVPIVESLSLQSEWAGWWIDQLKGGMPVFHVQGDPSEFEAVIAKDMPQGSSYQVIPVKYSLRELTDLMESMGDASDELRERGVPVTGYSLSVRSNEIDVWLDRVSESSKTYILNRFGGPLVFKQRSIAQSDVNLGCTSGCLPLKGGLGMLPGNPDWPCTVGYLIRRTDTSPDKLQFMTAGHCVQYGSPSQHWRHGSTSIGNSPTGGGNFMETFFNHSAADAGLVTVSSAAIPSVKNNMLVNADPVTIYPVKSWLSWAAQTEGLLVCRMGRRTGGPQCGSITAEDSIQLSAVDGGSSHWIHNVKVYGRDADSGDSGGPLFYTTGGSSPYAVVLGTHVHSDPGYVQYGGSGWYSTWDQAIYQLELSFSGLQLANPCTTAACGF